MKSLRKTVLLVSGIVGLLSVGFMVAAAAYNLANGKPVDTSSIWPLAIPLVLGAVVFAWGYFSLDEDR